ncbi:uncharacterized protein Hap1MRO34_020774 isoform 2-T2 [Clarias gariepinus]|uniref:uncharacterized protein LOC128506549 isoform X2 n=1 Tax=Clarias gariepinus TaxID=13013 RepID=UPI00234C46CB|nr:uncharacterized protein LOC128506549 isoform X2 [Clarias gariepinus]
MSCRLQSRITTILLLAATFPLCVTTYGSGFERTHSVQVRHSILEEPKNSDQRKFFSTFHQSNSTYNFQSDSPGFEAVQGKVNLASSHNTQEWLQMRPLVRCSPAAIILTAKGWNYIHLLVDRVGSSPVSILHLPSHCGYNVKATLRELVLVAPYDGCYVLRQNGSYVLPMRWWGMPLSISCPMAHDADSALAPAPPSGFCSYWGIMLKIEGSQRGVGKYSIKVNKKWVPLVSNTCAYRMDSAPEDLILFIPFPAQCTKDGGSTLNILLDGSMYTLSCQAHHYFPHYPQYKTSAQFSQPLHPLHTQSISHDPTLIKPEIPKPQLVPEITSIKKTQQQILFPSKQKNPGGSTGITIQHPQQLSLPSDDISPVPAVQSSEIPQKTSTEMNIPPFQPSFGHLQLSMPIVYPPYQYIPHPIYPYYNSQKPMPPKSHLTVHESAPQQDPKPQTVTNYVPQTGLWTLMHQPPQMPQLPYLPQVPHLPQPPQVPHLPQPPQVPHLPQHHRFPVVANYSSHLTPVLSCKGKQLRAFLPSAKINSIKVKDVKRKDWALVSSAPAHCGYSLHHESGGVVVSSPLPACHSYTVSPSVLSLSLKFWDPVRSRHHTVRLQCHYTSPSPTLEESSATAASLIPKPISTRFQTLKPEIRPFPSPYLPPSLSDSYFKPSNQPSIFTSLYPPKPSAMAFQQSKTTKAPKRTWPSQSTPQASQMHQPQVLCHSKDMSVILPPGPLTDLTVQSPTFGRNGSIKAVLLDEAPHHCGYLIKKKPNGGINILLPYTSCHMAHQDGQYRIILKYQTADGRRVEAILSCQVPMSYECNLPFEQQLACGTGSVSADDCHGMGCCYCPVTRACYYPMDECTADGHFVFSIPASLTEPPLSPALLVAGGNISCTPQRVVADFALFKIPLDGCGTRKYEVGNTVIYMLEILNTLHSVTQNYGTITRDSPFRLLVECRYMPGTVASVGYLVKSPSLGPSIQAQGVFGVQLRIAKDQQYSSYYPQYHRPLRTLLGKPLYLEVRLLNPLDPSAVLLVHYCVAYPRSANSAWVLIYDGCPNPLDIAPSHEPPPTPPHELAKHVRRFTVSTFQFLENSRKETAPAVVKEEEIYFMCATEVCLPSEGPCVEGCINHSPAVNP